MNLGWLNFTKFGILLGFMQSTKNKTSFYQVLTNRGLLPSKIIGIFLVKHFPTSLKSQEEINLGWLDFTKFGI